MEMGNNLTRKSIVYLTINNVNKKIYIGVHITDTPYKFDNYWGNGITGTNSYYFKHPKNPFHYACKKYGLKSFTRFTLAVYDTYEEALAEERRIVNQEFLQRTDVYNVALGGGVPTAHEIEAHQYDLDGNYIKSYKSKTLAGVSNGSDCNGINYAILHKSILNGSYWSETKLPKFNVEDASKPQNKKIYAYDAEGNFMNTYDSMVSFAKKYDITLGTVQRAVKRQLKICNMYISLCKVDKFVKLTKKRKRNQKIYKYDLNGNFLQEYLNFTKVKEEHNDICKNIHNAINNQESAGGFLWRYEKFDKIDQIKSTKKRVAQYTLDGTLVKVWNSYRECKNEFSLVRHVLSGARTQTKGFTFKYID